MAFFQHPKTIAKVIRNPACVSILIVIVYWWGLASMSINAYEQMAAGVTNVSVSGQPPLQLSSTSVQSAAGQPLARPSPTSTGTITPLPKSPEGPVLIVYVHNVSPLKWNKKNTIDHTTLTLQTDTSTTQPALLLEGKMKTPRWAGNKKSTHKDNMLHEIGGQD